MTNLIAYISTLVVFLAADMVWLGTMSGRFYKPVMGDILLGQFKLPPALVFYLAYPMGLVIFAVAPALKAGSLPHAVQMGALFGLFTYGTYDLTNQVTLRNWTTGLTLVDMAWGTVLGAMASGAAFLITSKLTG